MACAQIPDLPLHEFSLDKIAKWNQTRVPLNGSIELDLRCNLRCLHCYRDGEWSSDVLSTEEVKGILDQIAQAGCIWLLLTGGEVLMRRDFFEIYDHARNLGLKVIVFTNGTTVTEEIAERFAKAPPYAIEITLYGYSTETYEKVTGIPGSREKCYRGAELLMERGLPLTLKTIIMRTNKHEFMDMFQYAEGRGVRFKFDTMINPNFNGSMIPCNVRLTPKEAVDLEFSVPAQVVQYTKYFEMRKDATSSRVFSCGAGSRTFHIDPYGNMKMCLLLRDPEFSLREMSFEQIWNEMFPPIYNKMRQPDHKCNDCNLFSLCGKCPAWSQMEKGDMEARVEYTCEIGHRRASVLGHWDGPVDQYTRTLEKEEEILLPVVS